MPLKTKTVRVIDPVGAVGTGQINSVKLADCRAAFRSTIYVNNGFNQSVNVRVVTNDSDSAPGIPINLTPIVVDANSREPILLSRKEWGPFMGVDVTPAAAPTAGLLSVTLEVQELL